MFGRQLIILCIALTCPAASLAREKAPLYPEGRRLRALLDALDVEHHWLAGKRVSWRTGKRNRSLSGRSPRTHCSAFLAAACLRLKVPMLQPPPETYLSNRQQDWLRTRGKQLGWREVGAEKAQELTNRGYVVVASWKNREKHRYHRGAGHVAMVRPQLKDIDRIKRRGPQITQAGGRNYRTTSVAVGFHGRAWKKHQVRYFAFLRTQVGSRR